MGASVLGRGCDGAPQNPLEGERSSLRAVVSGKHPWSCLAAGAGGGALRTELDKAWPFWLWRRVLEQLPGHEETA